MTGSNRNEHIRLTSHPHPAGKARFPISWGAPTAPLRGPIIASVAVSNTGGWQSWGSVTTTLSGSATGVHTLYITFTGSGGDFVNLNWFQFAR